MKKMVITICLMLLLAGMARAITPLGPPLPSYESGEKAVGVEYAMGETTAKYFALGFVDTEKVDTSLLFATYNTGITDELELVVRVGGSELTPESLGSGYGVAAGFGVKYALPPIRNMDWAFVGQTTWMSSEFDLPGDFVCDILTNEIQFALGTEHVVNDHVTLYGGPFIQFLSGSGDIPITEKITIDVDMESTTNFGGFIGVEWKLDTTKSLVAELQLIGDGHSICGGFLWRF